MVELIILWTPQPHKNKKYERRYFFLYKKEETVKKIKPQIFRLVAVDCSYLGRVGISLFISSLTLGNAGRRWRFIWPFFPRIKKSPFELYNYSKFYLLLLNSFFFLIGDTFSEVKFKQLVVWRSLSVCFDTVTPNDFLTSHTSLSFPANTQFFLWWARSST